MGFLNVLRKTTISYDCMTESSSISTVLGPLHMSPVTGLVRLPG